MSKPFLLIDGSAYLYQAFYATSALNLTNAQGEPTGAIYGFINMLRKVLNQYQPKKVAVIFDAKGGSFRSQLYADYKATRESMPSDLQKQIDPIHAIVQAMGIQTLIIDNVEADDVIGTLAKEAEKLNYPVLIHSGDKDMAQLVSPLVSLLNTKNDALLTPEGVLEKFGVPPSKIIDFLALKGDNSDNIPGVPSIGDKSAITLLTYFEDLNDIYQRIDEIETLKNLRGAKSIKQKLIENKELAFLSYQLATIKTEVTLSTGFSEMDWQPYEPNLLLELFKQYNLKQHIDYLQKKTLFKTQIAQTEVISPHKQESTIDSNKKADQHYITVTTRSQLDDLISQLKQAELISFKTITDSLNALNCHLIGLSFAVKEQEAFYIPFAHSNENDLVQLDLSKTLAKLKPIFEDVNKPKVGHNAKFDSHVLSQYEIQIKNIRFDLQLESYLLNSQNRHDLEALTERYLHKNLISQKDLFSEITDKKLKKEATIAQVSIKKATTYAAEIADFILQIHHYLIQELESIPQLFKLFTDIEMPLSSILSQMEQTGVLLNKGQLKQYSLELEKKLNELEVKIHQLAGKEININSPKQLQVVLFDEMQLPVIKKTPKGIPSTNEEVLLELAKKYELPKLIIDYRGAAKLKNTYTDTLPLMVNPKDQRIHTNYNQVGTITGRLSSNDPNLQNIPIKNEEGRKIREAFIARPGYSIVSADYSQIELRIMAHLSQDPNLIQAFHDGKDIHRVTASEILNKAENEVTQEERRRAKAVNFGLIYGMSAFGLAKQIDISQSEAQFYIDRYFDRYPAVLNYMDAMKKVAHEQGFVETLSGRRLYLPKIHSKNKIEQRAAERAAINAPMQGTAADIIKTAMIHIFNWIKTQEKESIFLLMQVHDELVFEIKTTLLDEITTEIKQLMENCYPLIVPLKVDLGSGSNWNDAH